MENLSERDQKIVSFLKGLMSTEHGREILSRTAEDGGLRVLRQVEHTPFPVVTDPVRLAFSKEAVITDTETTGLVPTKDGVTQLSMLKIVFDDQGIISVGDFFDKYRDPGMPISEEAGRVTGITQEMVEGKVIEDSEILEFLGNIRTVICHNAGFDRKFLEHDFPNVGFDKMDFHCSFAQVVWNERGNNGRSLEVLALNQGFVFGAHDAFNDVSATAFVLNGKDEDGQTAFAEMYSAGSRPVMMIIAERSPFETKDALKEGGYSWSVDGVETGGSKSWYKVIDTTVESQAVEADLMRKVFGRDVSLPGFLIGADERYSSRKPKTPHIFRTNVVRDMLTSKVEAEAVVVREPQQDLFMR